jgi:aminomethyltransferase
MAENLKTTALHAIHKKLKAKMAGFGGWDMPISYQGVLAEHKQVREACGIFDVSHMGEIFVSGPEALAFLQYHTVNDLSRLDIGGGQYSALPTEDAGFVDDLIIYRLGPELYLLCVNASNAEKDYLWLKEHLGSYQAKVDNQSHLWSQIAIQGPKSLESLRVLLSSEDQERVAKLPYTGIVATKFFGQEGYTARTGYTGEWGYEIYLPNAVAAEAFAALLENSPAKPIGLGARDTLRLEACYLLYGNDMDETVSPIEAGIGWAVRFDKGEFLGKAKMQAQKNGQLPARKMVAFELEEQGIPRHGMEIYRGHRKIGVVTSGSFLPTLERAGGMALIESEGAKLGEHFEVDVRGQRKVAKIVKKPLYSTQVK